MNSVSGEDRNHELKKNLRKTQRTVRSLSFSKPKSRLIDRKYPSLSSKAITEDVDHLIILDQTYASSSTDDDDDDDDDQEEYNEDDEGEDGYYKKEGEKKNKKRKMIGWKGLIEWVLFFFILACLICSITINSIRREVKWGLEVWKWCVMIMVVFSGRLVSVWAVAFLVVVVERNFKLRDKVLYFVYGLRRSFQNCAWLGLVLLSWTFMFNPHVVHKKNTTLKKIFQALVAVLIDATIWLVKIILAKVVASSFHVETYFDRMKKSVFHQYILKTLSEPPKEKEEGAARAEDSHCRGLSGSKSFPAKWKERGKKEKVRKLSMEKSSRGRDSAWNVRTVVKYVRSSGLSTISKTVDDFGKVYGRVLLSTPLEAIAALKKAIQMYIESKPKHWNPKHTVLVKEIEDMNKMTMVVCVQHTINHQNYGERSSRISELIMEFKKIFENLGINYHLLPQEVHVTPNSTWP